MSAQPPAGLAPAVPQAASPDEGTTSHLDGLITLGNAAEHADLLTGGAAGAKAGGDKKRPRMQSLQLDLNEDEVIAELQEQGLITENPTESPKPFRGGRPPLGMGPFKRIKHMYGERMLSMEGWRQYYASKCLQHGYVGGFRKDLRPRLHPGAAPTRSIASG